MRLLFAVSSHLCAFPCFCRRSLKLDTYALPTCCRHGGGEEQRKENGTRKNDRGEERKTHLTRSRSRRTQGGKRRGDSREAQQCRKIAAEVKQAMRTRRRKDTESGDEKMRKGRMSPFYGASFFFQGLSLCFLSHHCPAVLCLISSLHSLRCYSCAMLHALVTIRKRHMGALQRERESEERE